MSFLNEHISSKRRVLQHNLRGYQLKYEKDNPPIIYDKSKKVKNARTTRKKVKEATIDGFENSKIQQKSLNADIRKAILGNIKLKIK